MDFKTKLVEIHNMVEELEIMLESTDEIDENIEHKLDMASTLVEGVYDDVLYGDYIDEGLMSDMTREATIKVLLKLKKNRDKIKQIYNDTNPSQTKERRIARTAQMFGGGLRPQHVADVIDS